MIKKLFIIAILGVTGYSIVLIATPHFNYFAFKSDVNELMRVSTARYDLVMEEIMRLVEKYDIPVVEKDIALKKNGLYSLSVSWAVTVDLFTLYQRTFTFHVDTARRH